MAPKDPDDTDADRLRRSRALTRTPGESVASFERRRAEARTLPPTGDQRARAKTVGVDQPLSVILGERPPDNAPSKKSFVGSITAREWYFFLAGIGLSSLIFLAAFLLLR